MFKWFLDKLIDKLLPIMLYKLQDTVENLTQDTVLTCMEKTDLEDTEPYGMALRVNTVRGDIHKYVELASNQIQREYTEQAFKHMIGNMIVETIDSEQFIDNVVRRIKSKQI